ncbi:hypothetical protein LEP1GSC132_1440 [Leptospira kirschneri str. 200803703]|uniref:Uncharacterized protein n=1 Tax=Leptospira kirschneri str. 200802841 TaxID=1193047 RepID=A0A828XY59_9LEPT|nr:hypothetical protein LEP1GSC131_4183 [Leptospira kirschneri str. 200802841]EKP04205.1 hypothetical protein LEP1GSC018_3464 [Leptospira kirschneri str. 2008720114]EKQ85013.1 hypothetical protein LEP1GSC064_2750 [Leptospira kirschneri serovar Grippotyphosa str. Moskva]EKR08832.1 hypothetical protein LEP1GSC122_1586 [Leptospira kirschneri serovar Valbuzzi str. 200702274]EMK03737.1 hypothetical protein LEP1GSC176_1559 [Leptospira kirschneri str. MMD1493]EMN26530.1 hypothetical protein LEP1GSC06
MGHGQAEEVLRAAVGEAAAELVTAEGERTVFMRILHFRKT